MANAGPETEKKCCNLRYIFIFNYNIANKVSNSCVDAKLNIKHKESSSLLCCYYFFLVNLACVILGAKFDFFYSFIYKLSFYNFKLI